jgi:hypothetical protein
MARFVLLLVALVAVAASTPCPCEESVDALQQLVNELEVKLAESVENGELCCVMPGVSGGCG